jgi:transposase
MRIDLDDLPVDTSLLHHLVRDMAAVVESCESEIERLQLIIKKLQRAQFGRRSERLDPDQMALALEDLDSDVARVHESSPVVKTSAEGPRPRHGPGASRCPIICRARISGSTSTARRAPAAAARSTPSARA